MEHIVATIDASPEEGGKGIDYRKGRGGSPPMEGERESQPEGTCDQSQSTKNTTTPLSSSSTPMPSSPTNTIDIKGTREGGKESYLLIDWVLSKIQLRHEPMHINQVKYRQRGKEGWRWLIATAD
jgi:hypothetical protein